MRRIYSCDTILRYKCFCVDSQELLVSSTVYRFPSQLKTDCGFAILTLGDRIYTLKASDWCKYNSNTIFIFGSWTMKNSKLLKF